MTSKFHERIGSVFQGRYRIVGFLGRGGMGAVYQCEDLRLPGKRWALKEMLVYDPQVIEQVEDSFKRESEMLSRLRHRNLPMIVDYFIEDARQYLVMEYIDGETLAKVIQREGPADELQALRWALELAQVLDYLHRQEKPVIFRDLKPENIIITEDRHIKLVDFGLARQFDPQKTRDTQASGSVGYAPPEQWEDVDQTDERSDIYSLGATLFFVLTARPPSPVYGSQRLRPFRPTLDAGAEAIVLRCLQPDPSQRYAGSGELIRDLLLWLSKQPGHNQPKREILPPVPLKPDVEPVLEIPEPRRMTPGWLLVLLQVATLLFFAGTVLGAAVIHGVKPQVAVPRDPILRLMEQTAPDKEKARQFLQKNEPAQAISLLDNIVTRFPQDAEAHILQANAYLAMQKTPVLRIPVLSSNSGHDYEGLQMLPGLALAQIEINKNGGLEDAADPEAGKKLVQLDLYDCQSRQDRAVEVATQVCANSAYQVAIGPWTSQQTVAVAPIFESAGMPMITPVGSDPRVWEAGKFIFSVSEADNRRVAALAQYFAKQGLRRGMVLHNDESIVSRSMASEFIEDFAAAGGQTLMNLAYGEDTSDLQPLVAKLRDTPAEFVFLAEYRSDLVLQFAQEMHAVGVKIPIASEASTYSHSILLQGGRDTEGMLTSSYFHPDVADPKVQSFVSDYRLRFGNSLPSHREANSYDSLRLVAQAIGQVGFERAKLQQYLASVGEEQPSYAGVSGEFAPAHRLDKRRAYLVQIKNGAFLLADPTAR